MKVIIMCGIPGSGKSTLTEQFPDFVSISQDSLGNRNDCIKALRRTLTQEKNVIIDRTNITIAQRNYFISVAKEYNVSLFCIFLNFPAVECVERIKNRKVHETLPGSTHESKIIEVVDKFVKSLEVPSYDEGFNTIFTCTNFSDLPNFVESIRKEIT